MLSERRTAARAVPGSDHSPVRLRLRTGHELRVIDINDRGARVEGDSRLLPGTCVEVYLVTANGRVRIRGSVLRSHVCSLTAVSIRYQSALSFETALSGVVACVARGRNFPLDADQR